MDRRFARRSGPGRGLRRLASLVVAALATAAPQPALASPFRQIGVANGLGAKVVPDVLVDRDGFLWVASREGLYRYDGYRAIRFLPDGGDPRSISDVDLRALYQDPDGVLWVATNTGGLNRFNPLDGTFDRFRHDSADPTTISYDSVYGMSVGPEGDLWVATQIGLNRLDRRTGTFTRFLHDPADDGSISHNYVFKVLLDPAGRLWIATVGGGVNRWLPETGTFVRYDLSASTGGPPELNKVFALVADPGGALWAGTGRGLVRIDADTGEVSRRQLAPDGHPEPLITSMVREPSGKLRLGGVSLGVVAYDPETDEVEQVGDRAAASSVPIMSLASTDGATFAGTWGEGVIFRRDLDDRFELLGPKGTRGGLTNDNITAVMATGETGRPWVGSFGGGVQRLDLGEGSAREPPDRPDALARAGVLALATSSDGHLWVGTMDRLWELGDDGRVVRFFEHDAGDADGLGEGYVTSLLSDADGLWVGVGGSGLHRLEFGADRFTVYRHDPDDPASLTGDYITSLLQGPDGTLWVGTRSSGLNLCRVEPWSCRRFSAEPGSASALGHHHVTTMIHDSKGRTWVGTDGGGLHLAVVDRDGDVIGFRRWGGGRGLSSNNIISMLEDDRGSLWLTTRDGIVRFDPDEGREEASVPMSDLPTESFNEEAAAHDPDYLYFGAVNGLLMIPAGTSIEVVSPTPVCFTSVEVMGRGQRPGVAVDPERTMSIDYEEVLQVEFAVLDYSEAPHRYEYRLHPEDDWSVLGIRNELTFAGLPPGPYRLQVRGRSGSGRWNESPELRLRVIPPFWMTWWFRVSGLAVLVLSTVAVHRRRMAALERRNRELSRLKNLREQALEQVMIREADLKEAYSGLSRLAQRLETAEEEERRRISHELHDEFGQTLTAAKISLQLAARQAAVDPDPERLAAVIAMVDSMIGQVRSIALRLRPALLDQAGLSASLAHHLEGLAGHTDASIAFEADLDLPEISPDAELVLFRVVQEAVGNSLRHAGPTHIEVALDAIGDDRVRVCISDDGSGFDLQEIRRRARRGDHLGLLGMQERVRSVGGNLELESAPGRGTRVEVTVPT